MLRILVLSLATMAPHLLAADIHQQSAWHREIWSLLDSIDAPQELKERVYNDLKNWDPEECTEFYLHLLRIGDVFFCDTLTRGTLFGALTASPEPFFQIIRGSCVGLAGAEAGVVTLGGLKERKQQIALAKCGCALASNLCSFAGNQWGLPLAKEAGLMLAFATALFNLSDEIANVMLRSLVTKYRLLRKTAERELVQKMIEARLRLPRR